MSQRLSATFSKLVCSCILSLVLVGTADAATVRGNLHRILWNGVQSNAPGVAVTLYNPSLGRTTPSYTDVYGMYYLYNIPPGAYYLEIWTSNPPMVFQIQVSDPYTDVPPVRVP